MNFPAPLMAGHFLSVLAAGQVWKLILHLEKMRVCEDFFHERGVPFLILTGNERENTASVRKSISFVTFGDGTNAESWEIEWNLQID